MQAWTSNRIALQPWQAIPERMAQLQLTAVDGMTQVWFVDENGRLSGGAEAVNEAMKFIWWARPFTWLYPLPGIRQLEEWAYRWVAKNRYRLPGSTTSCQLPSSEKTEIT